MGGLAPHFLRVPVVALFVERVFSDSHERHHRDLSSEEVGGRGILTLEVSVTAGNSAGERIRNVSSHFDRGRSVFWFGYRKTRQEEVMTHEANQSLKVRQRVAPLSFWPYNV